MPLLIPGRLVLASVVAPIGVRGPDEIAVVGLVVCIVGTLPHDRLQSDAIRG